MNTKRSGDVGAIILVAILIVGFVYILIKINPTPEQIEAVAKPVEPVNKDLLRSKEINSILTRTNNGNLPYKADSDQKPKDNPFSSLE